MAKFLLFTYLLLLSLLAAPTLAVDPFFQHSCVMSAGNFTANSTYEDNLDRILSQLTSQTDFNFGFYNLSTGENPNQVNAIAVCRGDRNQDECNNCLNDTVSELRQRCPLSKEVVGWSEFCMLRYANRDFFGEMEDSPGTCLLNVQNTNQFNFIDALISLLRNLSSQAAAGPGAPLRKYAAGNSTVGRLQTVYVMVQCTPDLSEQECDDCLSNAKDGIVGCCLVKMGCRVFRPSCILRYESLSFYQDPVPLPPPPPSQNSPPPFPLWSPPLSQNSPPPPGGKSPVIAIVASLSAIFGLTILCSGENEDVQLIGLAGGRNVRFDYSNEDFQKEDEESSQEFPSIQLDILHAATNNFSNENKLGQGGFGPVYKGTLPDGKEIAVKRLSRTSGQGLLEFKNEVMLIAGLQHRNLVRLLGCCLEKNEKLLVYEYMPNKSLDVFLFERNMAVANVNISKPSFNLLGRVVEKKQHNVQTSNYY
ncbi:hypothetical protein COLO4_31713 [Corchorus olitorius]|uniref:non-specific serine/threonine protein kinase n=1 Tax=Corchorus olitorius TaxID=93759 RepID=A0A1R3H3Q4_9ROSI|nr:hypothetical protein COLO4_31713 [Corchorus olitorius]